MKKYLTFLNEMTFNQIPTQFQMFSKSSIILGYKDYKFDFTSNKGTNYSVYITMTKEKNETKMFDGTLLPNVIIPTIYFSETKYGLDPIYFNKLTNKNEFAEVIGKVIYIILDFVKNNTEYEVYSIGEVSDKKEPLKLMMVD